MASKINPADQYKSWTKQGLIEEIESLKKELAQRPLQQTQEEVSSSSSATSPPQVARAQDAPSTSPKAQKKMDPSDYTTRFIALKLAYLGKNYGGFEFQRAATVSSIEEELWIALTRACLIFPEDVNVVDFTCCEYSKCGRTDKGVSAFGQVVGLRVRSSRPNPAAKRRKKLSKEQTHLVEGAASSGSSTDPPPPPEQALPTAEPEVDDAEEKEVPFDPIHDEIHYARVLNRILPKDIRVLAWCPSPPPDFSARFSCRERQYRYFFTQPAFSPEPEAMETPASRKMTVKPGWLDIDAMRTAAKLFEGDNDFRNLCKVDPAKQITNFRRVIFESDIEEVKDVSSALPYLTDPQFISGRDGDATFPKVYSFNVRGSAFLWHQIRHMVAILFLVGQGLEAPTLVSELLDVDKHPRKPNYNMADEVPLVLWDCKFPREDDPQQEALEWIYTGQEALSNKYGQMGLATSLWQSWREAKMDEILANRLLGVVAAQGDVGSAKQGVQTTSTRVYEGGVTGRMAGKYKSVMKRQLLETPDELNDRYAKRKGFKDAEDMRASGGFAALKERKGQQAPEETPDGT